MPQIHQIHLCYIVHIFPLENFIRYPQLQVICPPPQNPILLTLFCPQAVISFFLIIYLMLMSYIFYQMISSLRSEYIASIKGNINKYGLSLATILCTSCYCTSKSCDEKCNYSHFKYEEIKA